MLRNLLELVGVATDIWRCGRGIAKWEYVTTHQNDTENHRTEKCNENPFVDMALNFIRVVLMKLLSCCCQESTPFVADPSRQTLSQRASATFNGLLNASKG